MPYNIKYPSVNISASTVSAVGVFPGLSAGVGGKYIKVSNASTAMAYVTAGSSLAAATTANIGIPPNWTDYFERDPNLDLYGAVILASGTGQVSMTVGGEPND